MCFLRTLAGRLQYMLAYLCCQAADQSSRFHSHRHSLRSPRALCNSPHEPNHEYPSREGHRTDPRQEYAHRYRLYTAYARRRQCHQYSRASYQGCTMTTLPFPSNNLFIVRRLVGSGPSHVQAHTGTVLRQSGARPHKTRHCISQKPLLSRRTVDRGAGFVDLGTGDRALAERAQRPSSRCAYHWYVFYYISICTELN